MIGAGTATQTACHGDNGGPLLIRRGDRWIQLGVASFVATVPVACARPARFAELTGAQLAWLASIVPSITAAWGPCVAPSGAVGQTSAIDHAIWARFFATVGKKHTQKAK